VSLRGVCVEGPHRILVYEFMPNGSLDRYKFDSTYAERQYLASTKKEEYQILKSQWQSISQTQAKQFSKFRECKSRIGKDVVNTDRCLPYYAGDDNPNLDRLRDILLTYSFYNFDLGYCQGMSDLLSPMAVRFRQKKKKNLYWKTKYSIALDTAQGIAYLHDESRLGILHLEVKPQILISYRRFTHGEPKIKVYY